MAEPLLCVRDAEQAAARILPADIRDFIAGGSEAEVTLAANRAARTAYERSGYVAYEIVYEKTARHASVL